MIVVRRMGPMGMIALIGAIVLEGCSASPSTANPACSVVESGSGSRVLECPDGTSATLADGADGSSCTVRDNEDGTRTIACFDGTSVLIANGRPGKDQTPCTVVDHGDGTQTIVCGDTTTATVSDGLAGKDGSDGTACTVTADGNGVHTIACEDGTSASVRDGSDAQAVTAVAIRVDAEPLGSHCVAGGTAIRSGADENANGVLDETETATTSWVCNGQDGTDGAEGARALVRVEREEPGSVCPNGGVAIHAGLDGDGDGVLAPVEEANVAYLCRDFCGDGRVTGAEVCDDGFNDGRHGGCEPGCLTLSPSCGDAVVNGPEECDGATTAMACGERGFYAGTVACDAACKLDWSGCREHCGDGVVNGTEVCDDGVNDGAANGCLPGCRGAGCSDGYVLVPAAVLPDGVVVPAFCVMKFEAKDDGMGRAVSTSSAYPWANILWTAARTKCEESGARLIGEVEWLSIAHDVALVASNWTGGSAGSGMVFRGHSDGSPARALFSGLDDTAGYTGTGNVVGNQRRTLSLSNGSVIWDLAGNVWEWVDETVPAAGRYHGGARYWLSYHADDGTGWVTGNVPLAKLPPYTWNAVQGMGRYFDGSSTAGALNTVVEAPDSCAGLCASRAAFMRGGFWQGGAFTGLFSLNLNNGRASPSAAIGFRCVTP